MTQQATDPIQQALEYMRHQGAKSLGDLDALMERTGADWQRCLEGMTDAQASCKPSVPTGPQGEDEWCAKEVLGHVLVSNRGINQQIIEMAEVTPPIASHEKIRSMGVQSEAEEALPIAELRMKIAAVCDETRTLAASLSASDKLDERFPHPIFGPLNLKEWIAFHRIHAMDHIQQIEKIKADPAYPKGIA